jgi:hypothetical protein
MFRPFYAAGSKVTFSASEDGIQRDLTAQAHWAMAENLLTRVASKWLGEVVTVVDRPTVPDRPTVDRARPPPDVSEHACSCLPRACRSGMQEHLHCSGIFGELAAPRAYRGQERLELVVVPVPVRVVVSPEEGAILLRREGRIMEAVRSVEPQATCHGDQGH